MRFITMLSLAVMLGVSSNSFALSMVEADSAETAPVEGGRDPAFKVDAAPLIEQAKASQGDEAPSAARAPLYCTKGKDWYVNSGNWPCAWGWNGHNW